MKKNILVVVLNWKALCTCNYQIVIVNFRNVKKMKDYGKHIEWPRPPSVLHGLVELLKKTHGR